MRSQFRARQRVEMHRPRPPAEQVDATCPEFARAGSRQEETDAPLFDQAVHFVQQFGQPLDFVDDYHAIPLSQLLSDAAGTSAQVNIGSGIQQVVQAYLGERVAYQEGFAGLPGAQKKMRFLGHQGRQIQKPIHGRGGRVSLCG